MDASRRTTAGAAAGGSGSAPRGAAAEQIAAVLARWPDAEITGLRRREPAPEAAAGPAVELPARCQAATVDGILQCERCAVAFAPQGPPPNCRAADLIERVARRAEVEADRIRLGQQLLLEAATRRAADPGEITAALELEAMARLARACGHAEVQAALKRARAKP